MTITFCSLLAKIWTQLLWILAWIYSNHVVHFFWHWVKSCASDWVWRLSTSNSEREHSRNCTFHHFVGTSTLDPLVESQTSQKFKIWIFHDFIALSALLKQKKTYQKVKSEWCIWIPLLVTVVYTCRDCKEVIKSNQILVDTSGWK